MIGTIRLIDMSAAGAGAGGVARVDFHHGHAEHLRLVLDKALQLMKRPAVQRRPLRPSSPYPVTDALELFEGNALTGAFSLGDDVFADLVVDIGGKAAFFARELAQTATARLRAFALQPLAQTALAVADAFDMAALVDFAHAVDGDVGDAQVNAKEVFHIL